MWVQCHLNCRWGSVSSTREGVFIYRRIQLPSRIETETVSAERVSSTQSNRVSQRDPEIKQISRSEGEEEEEEDEKNSPKSKCLFVIRFHLLFMWIPISFSTFRANLLLLPNWGVQSLKWNETHFGPSFTKSCPVRNTFREIRGRISLILD